MEGLARQIDGYCERVDLSYWAEPTNALTNLAFIIAAVLMWRRVPGLPLPRALCAVLFAIGVGSYLFHTHATVWAVILDVLPIAAFILLYIYAANRHFWGMRPGMATLATSAFFPYAAVLVPVFSALPFLAISAGYWPVPLLIAIYALALWNRQRETAKGLALGAGLLVVSLIFRSLDELLCVRFPLGTHFVWHILNAIMLGWMIEVLRRHLVHRPVAQA